MSENDPNAPAQQGVNPAAPAANPQAPAAASPAVAKQAPIEKITPAAFNERVQRARENERKRLLEELGIDDPAKARAALAEHAQLKQQSEERRRAEMSEVERYKADLEAARAEAAQAREEASQARSQVDYEKRDSLIRQTAGKYVDDRFVRTARVEFKAYVESLSPSQQSKLTDQQMEIWMRKFARENPDFARKAGDTAKPSPTPVEKKPLTNGATPRRTTRPGEGASQPANASASNPSGKHARDMDSKELTQLARESGLKSYKPMSSPRRSVN